MAVCQAGLLPVAAPAHYSSAHAVSSQSIVRHDEQQGHYQAAPVAYHSAPVAYQSAPIAYQAAPVAYHAAPVAKISSGHAVSSQSIVRHDEQAYHGAPSAAIAYQAAPVAYHSAPIAHAAPIAYHSAPIAHAAPAKVLLASPHQEEAYVSIQSMFL